MSQPHVQVSEPHVQRLPPLLSPATLTKWGIVLFLIVVIFGFGAHVLDAAIGYLFRQYCSYISSGIPLSGYLRYCCAINRPPRLMASQSWELGALIFYLGFGAWFYRRIPPIPKKPSLVNDMVAIIVVGTLAFFFLGVLTIWWLKTAHILFVTTMSAMFLWADCELVLNLSEPNQQTEFRDCFLLVDIPIFTALLVLLAYQVFQFAYAGDTGVHVFLAGAISFQLIASTVLFALIQGGFSDPEGRRGT
jgi:hypothetical protein